MLLNQDGSQNTWFQTLVDSRADQQYRENPESMMRGEQTASQETMLGSQQEGLGTYLRDYFDVFLRLAEFLKPEEREMLLSTYSISKAQAQLSVVYRTTQTRVSEEILNAERVMASVIWFGSHPPGVSQMRPILKKHGMDRPTMLLRGERAGKIEVDLAAAMAELHECSNFVATAIHLGIHRPELRRTISRTGEKLRNMVGHEEQALGWWMFSLVDRMLANGEGYSAVACRKQGNVAVKLPAACGRFRLDVRDRDFDSAFAPRGMK